ncbi:Hypothetical protein PBC10988_2910 [Planctomycetales bacterium 10988]|nr:Hypothetical protein PBC10988_2910 [Planctomycetales bacterium 10988]
MDSNEEPTQQQKRLYFRQEGQRFFGELTADVPPFIINSTFCTAQATKDQGFILTKKTSCYMNYVITARGIPKIFGPMGFFKYAKSYYEYHGMEVSHIGEGYPPLPNPDWSKSLVQFSPESRWIDFIHQQDRGLIYYNQGQTDLVALLAQIACVFPKQKMLIVATRIKDVDRIYRELRKYVESLSSATSQIGYDERARVMITTYLWSGATRVQSLARPLVICLNPTELFLKTEWQEYYCGKFFGLIPDTFRPTAMLRGFLLAWFGDSSLQWLQTPAGLSRSDSLSPSVQTTRL